jgi:DNA polymerase-4
LERLHGADTELAGALAAAAQAAAGLAVRVGLAEGKFVAQQAARQAPANGAVVVPPGAEAGFLAPLPVGVLPNLPGETRRRLALLDLHTLGDLAGLRKPAVLRQFGAELSGLYELARGRDPRPLNPDVPPLRVVRSLRLAGPVSDRAILLNALQRLSWQMSKTLNAKGYHAEGLKLTLYTTSGAARELGQVAKPPTSDEARLARLAALLLGKLPVREPVVALALSAYPLRSWHLGLHQILLAEAGVPERETRFETALQVLVHRFGEVVLRVAALVGPPVPIHVTVTNGSDGCPVSYELAGQKSVVVAVDDAWREEREWWSRPLRRDYFRVQLADGSLRKIFQDLVNSEWYLDRSWPIL